MNNLKYKYHFRPGFESDKMLLEFISNVENENFKTDILEAIANLNPEIIEKEEIWVNDEILYKISTKIGELILSIDNWNIAFISCENNDLMNQLNDLVIKSEKFEKVEVDFDNFRKRKNANS
ncbi:MAG: hypothetical protein ABIP95_13195 [Pelobium sp.]